MIPADELLDRLKASPFVPFSLCLADGRRFEIRAAKQVWPKRDSVLVITPTAEDPRVMERYTTISRHDIERFEPLDHAAQMS